MQEADIFFGQTGLVKSCSESFLESFGYRADDVKGKSIVRFIHPDYIEVLEAIYSAEPPSGKYTCLIKTASDCYITCYLTPEINKTSGEVSAQVERVLGIDSVGGISGGLERTMRFLYTSMFDVYIKTDICSNVIFSTPGGSEHAFGLSAKEIIGKKLSKDIFADRQKWAGLIDKVNEHGYLDSERIKVVKPDGTLGWVQLTAQPIFNDNGDYLGLECFFRDITEKVMSEKELKHTSTILQTIFSHTRLMAAYLDFDLNFIKVNEAFAKLLGKSASQIEGKNQFDFCSREDYRRLFINCLKNGSVHQGKAQQFLFDNGPDKSSTYWDWEIVPVKDGSNTIGLILTIQNVTDRVKYENLLHSQNIELEKINRSLEEKVCIETERRRAQEQTLIHKARLAAMGEMIGAIAHQWRQPLNTVGLYVQDLLDAAEYGELDTEYLRDSTTKSMQIIEHMSSTIDDFRYFFKPAKEKSIFNVAEPLRDVLGIISAQLTNNNIKVLIQTNVREAADKFDPVLSSEIDVIAGDYSDTANQPNIYGYPNELKQVYLNILENAKDAIVENRENGSEAGLIMISVESDDGLCRIKISDSGGGIPEEVRAKIFDPYFSTKEDKGTGIGLYMARIIIENNMHGSLNAVNTDKGAEFTLEMKTADGVMAEPARERSTA